MLGVCTQLPLLLLLLCPFRADAASIKKTIDDSPSKNKIATETSKVLTKTSPPAIIAIEIVDEPQQNSTGKNTSKRTIESSLGYGYHGPSTLYNNQNNHHGKKFVIYKYSQHDIPSQSGYSTINSYSKPYNAHADIQESIGYNLGTITSLANNKPTIESKAPAPVYNTPLETQTQYYNPQNTYYTTFGQQGLGGISNQVPYQGQTHSGMVPVIFLRVYNNQLTSPNTPLYTNLPQSHPYSDLNNVNLQAYLQNYLQQYLQSQQPVYQPKYQHQQAYVQNYQEPAEYQTNLPTYENYPSQQHTRVVFHSDNNGHVPVTKTTDVSAYKHVSYPMYISPQSQSNVEIQQPNLQYTYHTPDVKSSDQGYMYVYPNGMYQNVYYQENNDYYQPSDHYEDNSNVAAHETTEQPYNYHAHPKKQTKEKRSKSSESEVTSRSHKESSSKTAA